MGSDGTAAMFLWEIDSPRTIKEEPEQNPPASGLCLTLNLSGKLSGRKSNANSNMHLSHLFLRSCGNPGLSPMIRVDYS